MTLEARRYCSVTTNVTPLYWRPEGSATSRAMAVPPLRRLASGVAADRRRPSLMAAHGGRRQGRFGLFLSLSLVGFGLLLELGLCFWT